MASPADLLIHLPGIGKAIERLLERRAERQRREDEWRRRRADEDARLKHEREMKALKAEEEKKRLEEDGKSALVLATTKNKLQEMEMADKSEEREHRVKLVEKAAEIHEKNTQLEREIMEQEDRKDERNKDFIERQSNKMLAFGLSAFLIFIYGAFTLNERNPYLAEKCMYGAIANMLAVLLFEVYLTQKADSSRSQQTRENHGLRELDLPFFRRERNSGVSFLRNDEEPDGRRAITSDRVEELPSEKKEDSRSGQSGRRNRKSLTRQLD